MELWISFLGICAHILEDQPNAEPSPVWGHRIVLVNASDPDANPNLSGLGIAPHIAQMQIFNEDIVSIQGPNGFTDFNDTKLLKLEGVTVQIVNNGVSTLTREAQCIPQLGAFVTDIAPGPAVTTASSALASCYFDFSFGQVLGTVVDKAPVGSTAAGCGVIMYKTETNGDPQILITPFDGSAPTLVTLQDSKQGQQGVDPFIGVIFMNLPLGEKDDNENDFMLHYLAANKFPDTPPVLGRLGCESNPFSYGLFQRTPGMIAFDLSVACSASNLP